VRGGPAACGAPAGSRSDKKLRHPRQSDYPARGLIGPVSEAPIWA